jgi:hypothetical protein
MQNILYRTEQLSYSIIVVLWSTAIDHSNSENPKVAAFLVRVIIFQWRDYVRAPLLPGQFPQYETT